MGSVATGREMSSEHPPMLQEGHGTLYLHSRLGQYPEVDNFYRLDALPVTQPTATKH